METAIQVMDRIEEILSRKYLPIEMCIVTLITELKNSYVKLHKGRR
jgi:hypothetical protein